MKVPRESTRPIAFKLAGRDSKKVNWKLGINSQTRTYETNEFDQSPGWQFNALRSRLAEIVVIESEGVDDSSSQVVAAEKQKVPRNGFCCVIQLTAGVDSPLHGGEDVAGV